MTALFRCLEGASLHTLVGVSHKVLGCFVNVGSYESNISWGLYRGFESRVFIDYFDWIVAMP